MIGSITLAAAVALVFYTLLPALSREAFRRRRRTQLELLRNGRKGYCAGVGAEGIRFVPAGTGSDNPVYIAPASARFLRVGHRAILELPGNKLRRIAVNAPMVLAEPPRRYRKRLAAVLVNGETNLNALDPALLLGVYDPLRYVWAALGIFIEFLFFITWLGAFSTPLPALAAMIAIFGKALPWCPPGLFLTLLAHRLAAKAGENKKKDRQRKTVGLLLVAVGVLLNLAAIFFGIRQTGWIPF